MKVFVTGVGGQLGHDVVNELNWRGYGHLGSDIVDSDAADYVKLDITDGDAVMDIISEYKPDVIVHCAAWTAVDAAEDEDKKATVHAVNVEGTSNIAKAAKAVDAKMVYISTDYVFGAEAFDTPIAESTWPAPLGVYGRTKLLGERLIEESGCDYVIIRTSWLYSTYGKNFVKTILRLAAERDELRVVNDQIGSPTYAKDLARVIVQICEREGFESGVYHYSNRGEISWCDFARAIIEVGGAECRVVPCTTAEYGAKAPRPAYSVLDTSKIRSCLGCEISDWRVALTECINQML